MNYKRIASDSAMQACLNSWEQNKIKMIALDIEAESNLHQYGEKLCLVQVFDGIDNIIIDPFGIKKDLIQNLLESKNILKIMYDASSDLSLLKNAHDIGINSILDLRPAVELLEYEKQDLHSVIEAELKIQLFKKKKYQTYNWTRRPLPADVLEYALNDVAHLFRLKTALLEKLHKNNLMDEYILKNILIQTKDYKRRVEDRYEKIKGYRKFNSGEKTRARKIFDIRDKYAKSLNVPPNNVIANGLLVSIAKGTSSIQNIPFPQRMSREDRGNIIKDLEEVID